MSPFCFIEIFLYELHFYLKSKVRAKSPAPAPPGSCMDNVHNSQTRCQEKPLVSQAAALGSVPALCSLGG